MSDDSELLAQALALPEADRAEMARRLILSLEPGEREEGWEEALAEEVERRMTAYERGETKAVPWREVMDSVKTSLKSRTRR